MGFATKVQLIKRKASEQWYINFPSAVAQAMEFSRGETVEWLVEDKSLLALRRLEAPATVLKKLRRPPPAVRKTLGPMRPRLRPAPPRRPGANPRAESAAVPRPPHRYRPAHHFRIAISGLDRQLSSLLERPSTGAGDLLRRPPRHRRSTPRRRALSRRARRHAAAARRTSHARRGLAPRPARPALPD